MCTEGEPKARVLLADDESVNRAVLRRAIERGGFDAVETSTGAEAVRAFQKLGKENGGFLCVLMDINMPDMDGLEAAWRIRQMEGTCERCRSKQPAGPGQETSDGGCRECCRVPIWAVSACSDRDQAFSPVVQRLPASCSKDGPIWRQVGMDEFMTKPVNVHQLQHKLAKLQMEMRRCKSGDNLATGDANLRMELASSGSLTRSWSDSQVWECPTMEACRAEDSSPLPRPPQPSKDSPPALAGSLHLPSIPALRVQRQGCQIP